MYVNKNDGSLVCDPYTARALEAEARGTIRKVGVEEKSVALPQVLPLFKHFVQRPGTLPSPQAVVDKFMQVDAFAKVLAPIQCMDPYSDKRNFAATTDEEKKQVGFVVLENPNQYKFMTAKPDGSAYGVMCQLASKVDLVDRAVYSSFVDRINEEVFSGGSMEGFQNRLIAKFHRDSPPKKFDVFNPDELVRVQKLLKFDSNRIVPLKGKLVSQVGLTLNPLAGAGSPWLRPPALVKRVLHDVAVVSQVIFAKAQEGYPALTRWLKENREHQLVVLANKREKMSREDVYKKVRPYYIFPGGLRACFTGLVDSYSKSLLRFDEDPDSISALGFSWAYGGADRMVTWFYVHKQPGVYFICFGDDVWVKVVTLKLEIILLSLDISGQDMSIMADTARIHYELYTPLIDPGLDAPWSALHLLHTVMMTNVNLLIYKTANVQKVFGSCSGINGTTLLAITASARVAACVQTLGIPTKESIPEYLSKLVALVKHDLQFTIKEEEVVIDYLPAREQFEQTKGRFLGMSIGSVVRKVKGVDTRLFVPVPDFCSLASSLVHYEITSVDREDPAAMAGVRMVRWFGILVSGAYLSPQLSAVIHHLWDDYVAKGNVPFNINQEVELPELMLLAKRITVERLEKLKYAKDRSQKTLPSEDWFLKLYTDVQVDVSYKKSTVADVEKEAFADDMGFDAVLSKSVKSYASSAASGVSPLPPKPKVVPEEDDEFNAVFSGVAKRVDEAIGLQYSVPPEEKKPSVRAYSKWAFIEEFVHPQKAFKLKKNTVLARLKELRREAKLRKKVEMRKSRLERYVSVKKKKNPNFDPDEDEFAEELSLQLSSAEDQLQSAIEDRAAEEEELLRQMSEAAYRQEWIEEHPDEAFEPPDKETLHDWSSNYFQDYDLEGTQSAAFFADAN